MKSLLKIGVFFTLFISGYCSIAQGTVTEYKKSVAVDTLFKNKIYNSPKYFKWQGDSLCWYKNNTEKESEYMLISTREGTQQKAFDHERLAASLSEFLEKKVEVNSIDIKELRFKDGALTFHTDSLEMECDLGDYQLKVIKPLEKKKRNNRGYWGSRFDETKKDTVASPDSLYVAFIKDYNLYVANTKTDKEFQLSYDGSKGNFYSAFVKWSPDSKKIMAYKVRPGENHKIYFVRSSPDDQLQPELESRDYLKPGDQLPFRSPQLFDVELKKHIAVATDLFDQQYRISNFKWKKNSSAFTFEYNKRGHQVYRILSVDASTGRVRIVVNETSSTFIDYSSKKFRYDTKDDKEIIWASERDGWNHLYLYDGETGKVKQQITKGNWPVRKVLEVDEENSHIYFTASGLDKKQDPYLLHYCRIDFDGKNFVRFTKENGNHKVTFSENHKYYIDQYSRVDAPPITVLKNAENQKTVMTLQEADIGSLLTTGWKMPEVFNAKGRDGETDIWGIIIRPTTFDPKKDYPIIEYIYAGPHSSFVPKSFQSNYSGMTSLAELGFIVVQIDGMGTSNRSKAFHNICWKNLKDAGFPDRKLWIKAAAKKYPYMNIDKVGIHGTSAGGQNAGAAVVFNSDFYKVAVASCGCHDNRMDKIWWNEQWMGYPVGPHYAACSNTENAEKMNGELLLMVGEVDDNVDPASTMQFADALMKANKNFDLVVLPGMSHTSGGEFGDRKRKDFFVKKLLEVNPPLWNKIYE
ncbi:DPP IV N-terminal domain-containing protein [Galbibacter sp. EGI 63066]|uniref:S9 family peptidase n=1 Tax=Galbibacter sp. EGI 63066 TaxID=2993559 RepID=UPI002249299A|nr:S9 family peptidase [Galbibacter sp. EGI 63066]MCX2678630.1 DPP IV N-terminal domain-containing protein [Galbibacter sp. EGI 63066]